jgi:hypothetical protein
MTKDDHKRPQDSEASSDSDSEIRDNRGKRARRESPEGMIDAAETFPAAVDTEAKRSPRNVRGKIKRRLKLVRKKRVEKRKKKKVNHHHHNK